MKKVLGRLSFWLLWFPVYIYSPLRRCARVLVVCGDEFLVVKAYFGSGHWQLPGGGGKHGETLTDTAVRELKEEVGLITQSSALVPLRSMQTYLEDGIQKRYELYTLKITDKTQVGEAAHEVAELAWFPLSTRSHAFAPHVTTALNSHK